MKSKITTYLLFASVLIIWGVIIWKLFAPTRPEIYTPPTSASKAATNERSDTLKLNYPDPFLKKRVAVGAQTPTNPPLRAIVTLERVREDCPIKYIGYMRRGETNYYVAKSNGVHHSVTAGDMIHGFYLAKTYLDSLIFTKDGLSYTINLAQ